MEYVSCSTETCFNECEKCNMLQNDLNMMAFGIAFLEDKLHQIHSVSLITRRALSETLACDCCAESVLTGIFRAIETITQSQRCEDDQEVVAS